MGCLDTVAMELLARCDHIYSNGCAEIAADQAGLANWPSRGYGVVGSRWFFFAEKFGESFFWGEGKVLPSPKG